MSDKIDFTEVTRISIEITDRTKLIANLFPKDKERLLKNLAAAAIHISLFTRDLMNHVEDGFLGTLCGEEEFLNKCGCKDERSDNNVGNKS